MITIKQINRNLDTNRARQIRGFSESGLYIDAGNWYSFGFNLAQTYPGEVTSLPGKYKLITGGRESDIDLAPYITTIERGQADFARSFTNRIPF